MNLTKRGCSGPRTPVPRPVLGALKKAWIAWIICRMVIHVLSLVKGVPLSNNPPAIFLEEYTASIDASRPSLPIQPREEWGSKAGRWEGDQGQVRSRWTASGDACLFVDVFRVHIYEGRSSSCLQALQPLQCDISEELQRYYKNLALLALSKLPKTSRRISTCLTYPGPTAQGTV